MWNMLRSLMHKFVDWSEFEAAQLTLSQVLPLHAGVFDVYHDEVNQTRA